MEGIAPIEALVGPDNPDDVAYGAFEVAKALSRRWSVAC